VPPERDFTFCLDFKKGAWKLKDVEGFIKQNIVYIMNGGTPHYVTRNLYDGHLSYKTVHPKVMKQTLPTLTIGKKAVSMYKVVERLQREICYKKVGFKPWLVNPGTEGTLSNTTGCEEFNLFTGMAHTYDPAFEVDTSKFDLLTKHQLEVWCNGDAINYEWLLSWLANIIQRPQQKIGIAVVLRSEAEGAGKGIIVEWFGKEVIGQEYYTKIDEIMQLTGKFTKHLAGVLHPL